MNLPKSNSFTAIQAIGLRRYWFVAAGSLIISLATTFEVQASCGDYLVVNGATHVTDGQGMETGSGAANAPINSPCRDQQCRRSPSLPSPAVPASSSPSRHETAHACSLAAVLVPLPFWNPVAESTVRFESGFPFLLERPPQV